MNEPRRDPPRRRADATQNRARIVEAARAVVARNEELKLNAIAKQAGVGQGTLYRHFPTREDLLAEVYRQDVDELVAMAPELLTRYRPLEALGRWLDRVADYALVKRGVFAAVEAAVWQDLSAHSLGPIGDAVTVLLEAGRAEGTIRADVDARDVIILIGYLSRLDDAEWDSRACHLLDVVLNGLRPHT
jgi:AcrR family transcriptional regulator